MLVMRAVHPMNYDGIECKPTIAELSACILRL